MSHRFVHASQTLAAGAVVFWLLGGCGFAPTRSAPLRRPPAPPPPPRESVTLRSLTGTWDAVIQMADGSEPVTLRLLQSGDALTGSLTIRDRTLPSDPSWPAHVDVSGGFVLAFGPSTRLRLRGHIDPGGDRISAQISGVQPQLIQVNFHRR